MKQTEQQKQRQDLNEEDLFFYKPESDQDRLDYLERQKLLSSTGASDRYSCLQCGKLNLSKEYYDVHLTGRAHKQKMAEAQGTSHGSKIAAAPPKPSTGSKTLPFQRNPYYIDKNKRNWRKKSNLSNQKSNQESVPRCRVDATGSTSNDVDVEPSTSTSTSSLSSPNNEFDTCIDITNNVYTCKICEVTIKQKINVKPHLKSKRHLQATKERVAMTDEAIAGTGELNEVAFTRNTDNPRPGCHFFAWI